MSSPQENVRIRPLNRWHLPKARKSWFPVNLYVDYDDLLQVQTEFKSTSMSLHSPSTWLIVRFDSLLCFWKDIADFHALRSFPQRHFPHLCFAADTITSNHLRKSHVFFLHTCRHKFLSFSPSVFQKPHVFSGLFPSIRFISKQKAQGSWMSKKIHTIGTTAPSNAWIHISTDKTLRHYTDPDPSYLYDLWCWVNAPTPRWKKRDAVFWHITYRDGPVQMVYWMNERHKKEPAQH